MNIHITNERVPKGAIQLIMSFNEVFTARLSPKILVVSDGPWRSWVVVPDHLWLSQHVIQSRYSLQIIKCLNPTCCKPFTTNWLTIFPRRFLPAPAVYKFGSKGLFPIEPSDYAKKPTDYKFATLKDMAITFTFYLACTAFMGAIHLLHVHF